MRDDIIWQLVWSLAVSCVFLYGSFLFLGSITKSRTDGITDPVPVKDELYPGMHKITGAMPLQQVCDELFLRTVQTSPTTYELKFETWSEPSVPCPTQAVARSFKTTLFAPPVGVDFYATLNGRVVPILMQPKVIHSNSSSSTGVQ